MQQRQHPQQRRHKNHRLQPAVARRVSAKSRNLATTFSHKASSKAANPHATETNTTCIPPAIMLPLSHTYPGSAGIAPSALAAFFRRCPPPQGPLIPPARKRLPRLQVPPTISASTSPSRTGQAALIATLGPKRKPSRAHRFPPLTFPKVCFSPSQSTLPSSSSMPCLHGLADSSCPLSDSLLLLFPLSQESPVVSYRGSLHLEAGRGSHAKHYNGADSRPYLPLACPLPCPWRHRILRTTSVADAARRSREQKKVPPNPRRSLRMTP